MNAIPLVFSFLIVFCIIQTAFLKEAPIALIEYQAFKEMLSFQREKCNTIERLLHKRARSSSMHSTASKSSKRTTKLHPSGRIYLYAIRPASPLYPSFKTALGKLFTLAYPFCSAEQIQDILNTLLDAVNDTQNTNEPLTLEYFEELGKDSELLTKLWKGTPHYNMEKKEGVIPLQHVLCFDPTFFRKPIYFPKAHYLVLKAFFDPKKRLKPSYKKKKRVS